MHKVFVDEVEIATGVHANEGNDNTFETVTVDVNVSIDFAFAFEGIVIGQSKNEWNGVIIISLISLIIKHYY